LRKKSIEEDYVDTPVPVLLFSACMLLFICLLFGAILERACNHKTKTLYTVWKRERMLGKIALTVAWVSTYTGLALMSVFLIAGGIFALVYITATVPRSST
jgi:hypothetical protein